MLNLQKLVTDTGIFMGVVKLTGQMGTYTVHDTYLTTVKTPGMTMDNDGAPMPMMIPRMGTSPISAHDRAVMIATSPQDGE